VPRFCITIREGRHQIPWHKKQEQSRISPSDTVVVLTCPFPRCATYRGPCHGMVNGLSLRDIRVIELGRGSCEGAGNSRSAARAAARASN
jgi:hypothetical protein